MTSGAVAFLLLVSLAPLALALKCHQCYTYDYLPESVASKLNNLNISVQENVNGVSGNCKSTNDFCNNGTFCAKKIVGYKVSVSGISLTYHTTFKTCATPDDQSAKNGECRETTEDSGTQGVQKSTKMCYCNNKDFCNNAATLSLSVLTLLFAYAFTV